MKGQDQKGEPACILRGHYSMMKKICILLAIAFCLIAFVSCGDSKKEFDPNNATPFEWIEHVAPDELKDVADFQTFATGKFYFKTEAEEDGMNAVMYLYFEGTKSSSVMTMDLLGKTIKSISKDGYSYTVIEQDKKYCKTKEENDESSFAAKVDETTYVGVEDKEIDGKSAKAYTFKTKTGDTTDDVAIYIADKKIVAFNFSGEPMPVKEFGTKAPDGLFDLSGYEEVSQDDISSILYS